jgi:hypothetical protein
MTADDNDAPTAVGPADDHTAEVPDLTAAAVAGTVALLDHHARPAPPVAAPTTTVPAGDA